MTAQPSASARAETIAGALTRSRRTATMPDVSDDPPHGLFDRVVALTGVSSVLAPGMVRRALVDGGADPAEATPADYAAALPRVRARLKAYVSEAEAERRIQEIEALLRTLPRRKPAAEVDIDAFAEDPKDFTTQGRRWTADELAQIRAARARQQDPGGEGQG